MNQYIFCFCSISYLCDSFVLSMFANQNVLHDIVSDLMYFVLFNVTQLYVPPNYLFKLLFMCFAKWFHVRELLWSGIHIFP